jgi:hypothetical protein
MERHRRILSVLLKPEDKERLAQAAREESRTMSDLAQLMIRAALDARDTAAKPEPKRQAEEQQHERLMVAA